MRFNVIDVLVVLAVLALLLLAARQDFPHFEPTPDAPATTEGEP